MTRIDPTELEDWARAVLAAIGAPDGIARAVAAHLVEANLKGHDSHGVGMLPRYVRAAGLGELVPDAEPAPLAEGPGFSRWDAGMGFGQAAMPAALGRAAGAMDGAAMVVTMRRAHHLGRIGHYAEAMAARGLVSIFAVNVLGPPPRVAAHGGRGPSFGTNPWTVGIPADPPLLLDMATSAIAHGKARAAHEAGLPLLPGAAIGPDGRESLEAIDGHERGALMPLGGSVAGHKGMGLAVMAEVLGGLMSGGAAVHDAPALDWGVRNDAMAILIDPATMGADLSAAAALADWLRARPAADGARVMAPGDPERAATEERRSAGIPLPDGTRALLDEAAAACGAPRLA